MMAGSAVAVTAVLALAAVSAGHAQSQGTQPGADTNISYLRGQSVVPVYQGWTENPDDTFDLHFSYINQNWAEELDIPIGENNSVSPAPYGPDGGQPTHFLPRQNRWQFTVRVPKDFGKTGPKEVIWTLTSHGRTHRAYGILEPGYAMTDFLIQFEFGGAAQEGRKPPKLVVEGEKQRMAKVGQPVPLAAVATDEGAPVRGRGGRGNQNPAEIPLGSVGGDFIRSTAGGLRLAWLVFRGAGRVTFDPPIPFKVWEDQRGGSPWAPGWQPPPIPPGNRWVHNVTFHQPGTYVLRAQAHTGQTFANENITFVVTP
jgi:hypothetical protein